MAGKGVAVTGVDNQGARASALEIFAAQLNFSGTADIARRYACNACAFVQFDKSKVAPAPIFIARTRNTRRCTCDDRHIGKRQRERGFVRQRITFD